MKRLLALLVGLLMLGVTVVTATNPIIKPSYLDPGYGGGTHWEKSAKDIYFQPYLGEITTGMSASVEFRGVSYDPIDKLYEFHYHILTVASSRHENNAVKNIKRLEFSISRVGGSGYSIYFDPTTDITRQLAVWPSNYVRDFKEDNATLGIASFAISALADYAGIGFALSAMQLVGSLISAYTDVDIHHSAKWEWTYPVSDASYYARWEINADLGQTFKCKVQSRAMYLAGAYKYMTVSFYISATAPSSPPANFRQTLSDKLYNAIYKIFLTISRDSVPKFRAHLNGKAVTVYVIPPRELSKYADLLGLSEQEIQQHINLNVPIYYILNYPMEVHAYSYVEQ